MRKTRNKNKIWIFLVFTLVILIGVGIILYIIYRYKDIAPDNLDNSNVDIITDNNIDKDNKDSEINQVEYNADDYIELEDVIFNDRVSTKKVKFKNLDSSLTNDFYQEQDKVIDSIHVSDSDIFNAEYKLQYFINDNILSVLYMIEESNEIGTCATKMAVTNIDLKNNRVLSEEELLDKVNITYQSFVEEIYEKELDSWKKHNDSIGFEMSYYEVTFADFRDNKEKYVNEGINKIPDIIYTYVKDGKIQYDYYTINLDSLFHPVGKGGCFNWKTVELGDYK